MNLVIFKEGQRQGPYSFDEARRLRAEGKLTDTDYTWYEGLTDWIALSAVPGLFSPVLPPPPPASIPAPPTPTFEPGAVAPDGGVLLAKRLATSFVLFLIFFIVLFVVIYVLAMVAGGAVSAFHTAPQNHGPQSFQEGYAIGQEAGREFARRYMGIVALLSSLVSLVLGSLLALWVAFAGWLPWCRRR